MIFHARSGQQRLAFSCSMLVGAWTVEFTVAVSIGLTGLGMFITNLPSVLGLSILFGPIMVGVGGAKTLLTYAELGKEVD